MGVGWVTPRVVDILNIVGTGDFRITRRMMLLSNTTSCVHNLTLNDVQGGSC